MGWSRRGPGLAVRSPSRRCRYVVIVFVTKHMTDRGDILNHFSVMVAAMFRQKKPSAVSQKAPTNDQGD